MGEFVLRLRNRATLRSFSVNQILWQKYDIRGSARLEDRGKLWALITIIIIEKKSIIYL